ncbi:MAG: DUF6491 family protein [Xanthomonadales bacterium]|nr:DUF6491 family protein [Xanthomonadales bacterium]
MPTFVESRFRIRQRVATRHALLFRWGGALLAMGLAVPLAAAAPVSLKARDVRSFEALDSRTLVVTTWHRHQWRIELSSLCFDLEGAHTIAFRSSPVTDEVDRFASVLTRMSRCPIREVSYIGREPPRSRKAADHAAPRNGEAP